MMTDRSNTFDAAISFPVGIEVHHSLARRVFVSRSEMLPFFFFTQVPEVSATGAIITRGCEPDVKTVFYRRGIILRVRS
jgi:hypothetical protein